MLQGGIDDPNAETSGPRVTDITLLMTVQTTSNDEYYQTVVVNSLVQVLSDSALKDHHYEAVEAVMLIFRAQRLRCVSFLPQVCPRGLAQADKSDSSCISWCHPHGPEQPARSLPQTAR